ncbi:MAG: NGG1p interacting factor NIF3 [Bacteriovoracaceae bacterium]
MFHISFYVPVNDADNVKNAMFQAGAGKIGNYDNCSFEIKGMGQFRPLTGSDPTIGSQGVLEQVEELKVDMVCDDQYIKEVVAALKKSHPYETPAYYVIKVVDY